MSLQRWILCFAFSDEETEAGMSFNFTTKSVRSLLEKRSSSSSPGKRKTYGIKFVQCDTVAIFFCFILIHFKEKVLRGDYPNRWNHVSKICKAASFALHKAKKKNCYVALTRPKSENWVGRSIFFFFFFFFFFFLRTVRVEFSNIFKKVSNWGKLCRNAVKTHIQVLF